MSFTSLLPPPRLKAEVMRSGRSVCHSVCLSVCLSVCRITAKVINRFHWSLVLWLGWLTERTG